MAGRGQGRGGAAAVSGPFAGSCTARAPPRARRSLYYPAAAGARSLPPPRPAPPIHLSPGPHEWTEGGGRARATSPPPFTKKIKKNKKNAGLSGSRPCSPRFVNEESGAAARSPRDSPRALPVRGVTHTPHTHTHSPHTHPAATLPGRAHCGAHTCVQTVRLHVHAPLGTQARTQARTHMAGQTRRTLSSPFLCPQPQPGPKPPRRSLSDLVPPRRNGIFG